MESVSPFQGDQKWVDALIERNHADEFAECDSSVK